MNVDSLTKRGIVLGVFGEEIQLDEEVGGCFPCFRWRITNEEMQR